MSRAFTVLLITFAFSSACGDEGGGPAVSVTDSPLTDAHNGTDSVFDAADSMDVEILYLGYPCDKDDACSTGYCYGAATTQGFFEPAECQLRCLDSYDYMHYCDSDDDCCRGKCATDSGPQRGLCIPSIP